jgi:lipopolysaccharide cholinephosphotransferase
MNEQAETEQIKKIQKVNLEMAKYFVRFCEQHQLTCYFCGGGCIGTVRNQGFIPWDDDLDFFMPREDYEKLYDLWINEADLQNYPILRPSATYIDHNSFTTIRETDTTFIKPYQKDLDIPHGLPIDIFPLDGAPDSTIKRKIQKIWALIYALFCSQVVPEKHGGIMALGSRILLKLIPTKKGRYRIWSLAQKQMTKYDFNTSEYVTELCVGPKYMGNLYKRTDFEKAIFLPFEDTKMPVPVGYDRYLTQVFGNYMELPPEKDRVSHHDAVYIDTEHSYKKYKGIYYCTNSIEEE